MPDNNDEQQAQESGEKGCETPLSPQEEALRQGRKSLTMPVSQGGKNRVRYVEGTKKLKDGCWLSEN